MSCVWLWSAISRVAKPHISAWRTVVAVILLGLTVVAGCDVRPFCEAGGSCSSDGTDDNGGGGDGEIELESDPEAIDTVEGALVTVRVRVVNRVSGRTYSFDITEQPTFSGEIDDESIEINNRAGTLSFRFEATTPTNFDSDNIEISVRDSADDEGTLDIDVSVDPDPDANPPVVP